MSMPVKEDSNGMLTPYEDCSGGISLTGTTKFAPLPEIKSILVTGGAGFMYGKSLPPSVVLYNEVADGIIVEAG